MAIEITPSSALPRRAPQSVNSTLSRRSSAFSGRKELKAGGNKSFKKTKR